jgi:ubiquinol-cytochrome c reductase cytochrome b subunit
MGSKLRAWFLDRLHLSPRFLDAVDKPLPRGVGWLNTLGSTALLLIGVQVVTGMLLGFYYAPSTQEAYESLSYIQQRVLFGRLVQGLHHYGASAVVVVLLLHLLRVLYHGAYKPPRELIWVFGVLLLAVVLGFAFTGYLLPWDQKAYWATVVGTEMAGATPVVGPAIRRVLVGGAELGPATLTHFFALHVLVLPLLLYALVAGHVALVWRKGPTSPGCPVGREAPPASRFLGQQLFKDATVMGLVVAFLLGLAWLSPVRLEPRADPNDPSYVPRPEWYFLAFFQLLKYLPGGLEIVAILVLPALGAMLLLFLPWLDRSRERRARRRPWVTGTATAALAGMILLTSLGMADRPHNVTPADNPFREAPAPLLERGRQLYAAQNCGGCHLLGGRGGHAGPALDRVARRRKYDVDWMIRHLRSPAVVVPGSTMPPYNHLSKTDLQALTAYLFADRFNWPR